ncbi:MAG: ribose transport system permease protein [Halanaerobiales bacterium]|nr:ribose transport system permease protein [Halanaerobiales bacterium]
MDAKANVAELRNSGGFLYRINNSYYKPEIYAGIGLVLLSIILSFASPYFLESRNLINLARQISLYAIIASGMTFVILTGGIDLSVGSIVAVTGTFIAGFIKSGMPILVAVILGFGIGLLFGLFNGFIIANTRIPAIIVTLASMSMGRGTALLYSNGYPISGLPNSFKVLGRGYLGPFPIAVYIMVVIFILTYIVLNKTKFGRHVYALGGNEETVRLSGINVRALKMKVYVISGLMSAISGLILASRLGSGQPLSGDGWELDVIAAVVVGGTDIAGGRGTIIGTIIGAFIIGVLNNGLNLLNVSPYLQLVVKGLVIIGAVFVRAGVNKAK